MQLTFQPYQDSYLATYQALISEWRSKNPNSTLCHPGDIPHRLYNVLRGKFDLSEVVRCYYLDNQAAAIVICDATQEFINLFINPDLSEQIDLFIPVVDDSLKIIHEQMVKLDKADEPIYIEQFQKDTHRTNLLKATNFTEAVNEINLTRRNLYEVAQVTLPDGFSIRGATHEDYEQLAEVHNRSFGSGFTPEIYRDEVMLKPGYDPQRELVVVAPDGRFAAFCVIWFDDVNKVGLFEPVGTHEEFRRMGLASTLMTHAMSLMKARGMEAAEVCYETENEGSKRLYTGLGFEMKHPIIDWNRPFKGTENNA